MLPGDDLGWRPPSDLCKADAKVDVSFGGRELLSGVGEAGPCVTWCARFRCGSPLDRTGGRRRGSVRWRSGLAEKFIRTIAEKCLRKGLRIKVAHCAPRKRAKNLDPRERVGKIWRWCGELFAMRVLLRSSRSLSRMSVREVLAALDIQLRQPGQLCNNLLHEFWSG